MRSRGGLFHKRCAPVCTQTHSRPATVSTGSVPAAGTARHSPGNGRAHRRLPQEGGQASEPPRGPTPAGLPAEHLRPVPGQCRVACAGMQLTDVSGGLGPRLPSLATRPRGPEPPTGLTFSSSTPSLSSSSSQASPVPSLSKSSWPELGSSGQLSCEQRTHTSENTCGGGGVRLWAQSWSPGDWELSSARQGCTGDDILWPAWPHREAHIPHPGPP